MPSEKINALLEQFKNTKELKDTIATGDDEQFTYTRIPFNIPALDNLLGGGIPRKRLTLIEGQSNSGKSYLAAQVVKNAQQAGGIAGWIDAEMSWDKEWMKKCGVDVENVLVSQPETGEAAFNVMKALMQAGVDVVVLDSVAGLVPGNVMEENFSYNPQAWQARMVNSSIPRVFSELKHNTALIFINQVRATMAPGGASTQPGGQAQGFFAHLTLEVRRSGWIEDTVDGKKVKTGFNIHILSRKTKVSGDHYQAVEIPFRVEGGLDTLEVIIREGIGRDFIQRRGPWLYYKDQKFIGMDNMKKFFKENEPALEELKKAFKV